MFVVFVVGCRREHKWGPFISLCQQKHVLAWIFPTRRRAKRDINPWASRTSGWWSGLRRLAFAVLRTAEGRYWHRPSQRSQSWGSPRRWGPVASIPITSLASGEALPADSSSPWGLPTRSLAEFSEANKSMCDFFSCSHLAGSRPTTMTKKPCWRKVT